MANPPERVVDRHHPEMKGKAKASGSTEAFEQGPTNQQLRHALDMDFPTLQGKNTDQSADKSPHSKKKKIQAPTVKFLGKEMPLYTHPVTKGILAGAGAVWGLGTEAGRSARDRALTIFAAANDRSEILTVDTRGLNVIMELPIVQHQDTGKVVDRVHDATKGLVNEGKFHLREKLPPKHRLHPADPRETGEIVPTSSSEGIWIGPRKSAARTRSELIKRVNPTWPGATLEFRGSAVEKAMQRLKDEKADTPLAQRVASLLMPDLDMHIYLRYLNPDGELYTEILDYSFSQNPLRFDRDGRPIPLATAIQGRALHPILMGLKDFSAVISAHLLEQTGGVATLDPGTLHEALILAPKADEDTRLIIEPYMYRMLAVDWIEKLLTQHPSEFIEAITRTVNFTTIDGQPLGVEQSTFLATELIGGVLGLQDAPHQLEGYTYVDFVTLMNQVLQDRKACIQWAGNTHLVSLALDEASSMRELHTLVKKMGVNNPESFVANRRVMSPASFFGLTVTPELLFIRAVALLAEENAFAVIAKDEARRSLARSQTIIQVVEGKTEIEETVWQAVRDEFDRQKKAMSDGALEGKAIGKEVAQVVKDDLGLGDRRARRAAAREIIDGVVRDPGNALAKKPTKK